MRLPGRQQSRAAWACAALGLLACALLALPGSALARTKSCTRISSSCGTTVSSPLLVGGAPGAPPPPSSRFGIAVKTAPTATLVDRNQSGTLVGKVDVGRQVSCAGYTKKDPITFAFQLLTATPVKISYLITDRITNATANGIHFCLAANFHFRTFSGKPAAPTVLPDGTHGYVGLLPMCVNPNLPAGAATRPCVQSVTTASDSSSSTGEDVIMTVRVPVVTKGGGDPWGGS
ncbi:MAG TPA: hypothetical protein VMF57_12170 [Solirubrobacteraceae bacterium]|nr:hypothetical protein [Solirubrobacteraceae bacterium]